MKNIYRRRSFLCFYFCLLFVFCFSCSNNGGYNKTPIDKLIVEMSDIPDYSIILNDMDYRDGKYVHEYKIVEHKFKPIDTLFSRTTSFLEVSPEFFQKHEKNLGMEIVSKVNGKLSKVASPPGYNTYVGNSNYGHWVNNNGSSFWEFYGRYAMLNSMFHMMSYPVRRSYYDDFDDHRRRGRSYYGPANNGRHYYGTGSTYSRGRGNSSWENKPKTFKDKVRTRVSRSVVSRKNSKRVNRSSSRYKSSSMRSRGGGFGK
ncbi:MAG: hypothetical protein ACEPOW_12120 [Bacteroidales bacterium]